MLLVNFHAARADGDDAPGSCDRIIRESTGDRPAIRWYPPAVLEPAQIERIRAELGEEPIAIAYEDDGWKALIATRKRNERVRVMPGAPPLVPRGEISPPPEGIF